ncbi:polysaccharide deacetylase family protein [Streptosporangium sp. NPDC004379]|uniref:polysaccharide deacetylase family protein n=1 Tax=Streptosporangium sp. NPDC004379 TaxID=3366189 RepID=UPI0036A0374C
MSIDTEFAWGVDPSGLSRYSRFFDEEPRTVRRLIDLLDEYLIPATWAVVGRLLLEPDGERRRTPESWYHAPYILDWILGARAPHEIGTHTFSHLHTGNPSVTREEWVSDLETAVRTARELGVDIRSIVYPRNQVAYTEILPDFGIIAYRGVEKTWYGSGRGGLHFLDRALGVASPTYSPSGLREGDRLVNIPASQFLMGDNGVRRMIPPSSRIRQARLALDRAARRGEIYHLWFHPFNLGGGGRMFQTLERILRDVAARRERGELTVVTMGEAARLVLQETAGRTTGRPDHIVGGTGHATGLTGSTSGRTGDASGRAGHAPGPAGDPTGRRSPA